MSLIGNTSSAPRANTGLDALSSGPTLPAEPAPAQTPPLALADKVDRSRAIHSARIDAQKLDEAELKELKQRFEPQLEQFENTRQKVRTGLLLGGGTATLPGLGVLSSGLGGAAVGTAAVATGGIVLGIGLIAVLLYFLMTKDGPVPMPGVDGPRQEFKSQYDLAYDELMKNQAERRGSIEAGDTRVKSAMPVLVAPKSGGISTARSGSARAL